MMTKTPSEVFREDVKKLIKINKNWKLIDPRKPEKGVMKWCTRMITKERTKIFIILSTGYPNVPPLIISKPRFDDKCVKENGEVHFHSEDESLGWKHISKAENRLVGVISALNQGDFRLF